jgi:TRAP transporter 4TM/12TM fusion protein
VLAAVVPAFMHFLGVFTQVHFEAKRDGLRGLSPEEMPDIRAAFARDWPTVIPLVGLIWMLFSGYTPYLAAFTGITLAVLVGLLHPKRRLKPIEIFEGLRDGAKYALAVGVAAASVGIVIGVVTLTGVGFKISFIVTSTATDLAQSVTAWLPLWIMSVKALTLFFTLLLTAVVCILMGCGIPTTATYIIMVTVAAPALGMLGVEPIVAHFFVFYFGVLADITPPVAIAAYAAAGMAGADPFKTGNTAFRLALGKALVPFVFVFSPSLLLVVKTFSWGEFAVAAAGCVTGIVFLSAAFSKYFLTQTRTWERLLLAVAAILLIAPELRSSLIGLGLVVPVILAQLVRMRGEPTPAAA